MNNEEVCNTSLGLGINQMEVKRDDHDQKQLVKKISRRGSFWLDLSLPSLHSKIELEASDHDEEKDIDQDSNSSSKIINDEREKDNEDTRRRKGISDCSNDDIYRDINTNTGSIRKKLKLTTEQIALLEDNFKSHTTLNTRQKQELAKKVNLLPRQIEVWFQNRRARTKLKQIEQECILLRKYCETLSDENRRLKKELREAAASCPFNLDHNHHQVEQPPPIPLYIRCPTTKDVGEKSDR